MSTTTTFVLGSFLGVVLGYFLIVFFPPEEHALSEGILPTVQAHSPKSIDQVVKEKVISDLKGLDVQTKGFQEALEKFERKWKAEFRAPSVKGGT